VVDGVEVAIACAAWDYAEDRDSCLFLVHSIDCTVSPVVVQVPVQQDIDVDSLREILAVEILANIGAVQRVLPVVD